MWMRRISARPLRSGRSTSTWRSNRPARSSAGSSVSGRLVAPSTTTPLMGSKPSSSARSWFRVCSFSSFPPAGRLPPRARPSASSSSMKTMAGACLRACSNRSRTRAAPTPTNISTNSEPEIEKNGTPASPATARASQRLAGARRPDEQDALRDMRAEPSVFLRILEELDDLLELVLGLVDAGDVVERDLGVALGEDARAALADGHQPAAEAAGHRPDQPHPEPDEHQRRHDPAERGRQEAGTRGAGERHLGRRQRLGQFRVDADGREAVRLVLGRVLVLARDPVVADHQVVELALLQQVLEPAVRDRLDAAGRDDPVLDPQHRHEGEDDVPEVDMVLALELHGRRPPGCLHQRVAYMGIWSLIPIRDSRPVPG